jgi:hypothetical protein
MTLEMFCFGVRARDSGGLVFEDDQSDTLEKGLTEWFNEQ